MVLIEAFQTVLWFSGTGVSDLLRFIVIGPGETLLAGGGPSNLTLRWYA